MGGKTTPSAPLRRRKRTRPPPKENILDNFSGLNLAVLTDSANHFWGRSGRGHCRKISPKRNPQISAKFLQNFHTPFLKQQNGFSTNIREVSAEFPQTFRKKPFANDPTSELLTKETFQVGSGYKNPALLSRCKSPVDHCVMGPGGGIPVQTSWPRTNDEALESSNLQRYVRLQHIEAGLGEVGRGFYVCLVIRADNLQHANIRQTKPSGRY